MIEVYRDGRVMMIVNRGNQPVVISWLGPPGTTYKLDPGGWLQDIKPWPGPDSGRPADRGATGMGAEGP